MRIAVSIGDPNGIGPEVILKALGNEQLREGCRPVVVGSRGVLEHYAARLGLGDGLDRLDVEDVPEGQGFRVEEGRVSAAAGALAMAAVSRACALCSAGAAGAMVTAPISKAAIHLAGYPFPGHTEFLAERLGAERVVMLMAAADLRVALLTTHIPLREVSARVTPGAVLDTITTLHDGLRDDFGVERPRLALLAVNPHAGEGGVIGDEELETLAPALRLARERGMAVSGPHAADAFFGRHRYRAHDAVLACYHDQGLVPFKLLAMGRGVNVTLGLPVVRTSPDHGTAFEIAGRGIADPSSLTRAVMLAAQIAERRQRQARAGA